MRKNVKSGKLAPEKPNVQPGPQEEIFVSQAAEFSNEDYNRDLKERLNEKEGGKCIDYEQLIKFAPDFASWIKEIVRYHNVNSQVLMFIDNKGENRFHCYLYTQDHCYHISGHIVSGSQGYLGCTVTTRKERVGEYWNRGYDLPDGPYSKKTFDSIVKAIVSYELKTLQLWR